MPSAQQEFEEFTDELVKEYTSEENKNEEIITFKEMVKKTILKLKELEEKEQKMIRRYIN